MTVSIKWDQPDQIQAYNTETGERREIVPRASDWPDSEGYYVLGEELPGCYYTFNSDGSYAGSRNYWIIRNKVEKPAASDADEEAFFASQEEAFFDAMDDEPAPSPELVNDAPGLELLKRLYESASAYLDEGSDGWSDECIALEADLAEAGLFLAELEPVDPLEAEAIALVKEYYPEAADTYRGRRFQIAKRGLELGRAG